MKLPKKAQQEKKTKHAIAARDMHHALYKLSLPLHHKPHNCKAERWTGGSALLEQNLREVGGMLQDVLQAFVAL